MYVYTLACPTTNDIKYVGSTVDLDQRLRQHLTSKQNPLIRQWVDSIGISPKIEVIDLMITDCRNDVFTLENFWIQQFEVWGFRLFNRTGNMGYTKPSTRPIKTPKGLTWTFIEKTINVRRSGDIKMLMQLTGKKRGEINKALTQGVCTPEMAEIIISYFTDRIQTKAA